MEALVMKLFWSVAIKGGALAEVAAFLSGFGFEERMAMWGVLAANMLRNLGVI